MSPGRRWLYEPDARFDIGADASHVFGAFGEPDQHFARRKAVCHLRAPVGEAFRVGRAVEYVQVVVVQDGVAREIGVERAELGAAYEAVGYLEQVAATV